MYLPNTATTCQQGPLPATFNPFAQFDYDALTGAWQAAQGAFDGLVNRLDIGPNGMPWGSGPLGATEFGLARTPPLNITWPGVFGPGVGWNPNGQQGGPGSAASNPRVLDYPFCTPMALAQQFTPPVEVDACVTGRVGGVVYGPVAGPVPVSPRTPPPVVLPPQITQTPNPRTPPPPRTGNLCADLQSGAMLQSDADPMDVYKCSVAGWVGVGPSPLEVIQASQAQAQAESEAVNGLGGLSGLGCCDSCKTTSGPCAGNPRVSQNGTMSPAERARAGMDGGWVVWAVLAAAAVYAVTQPGKAGNTQGRA